MGNTSESRCLIDNWSLQCAAMLVEEGMASISQQVINKALITIGDSILFGDPFVSEHLKEDLAEIVVEFPVLFGAFSNVVNALVLFDKVLYPLNGYEKFWIGRFPRFAEKIGENLEGVPIDPSLSEALAKKKRKDHFGIHHYETIAEHVSADLLLNPIRVEERKKILDESVARNKKSYGNHAQKILERVDSALIDRIHRAGLEDIEIDGLAGFQFPSVMALSVAERKDRIRDSMEIIDAALELREKWTTKSFRAVLRKTVSGNKPKSTFLELLEAAAEATAECSLNFTDILKESFFMLVLNIPNVSASSLEPLFRYFIPSHKLFLRDLARCRLESERLSHMLANIKW